MSAKRTRKTPNHAAIFAALGDEIRLRIAEQLCEHGPQSIMSLTEGSGVTRQGITKHLRVMEKACLVRGTRQGREILWTIEAERLKQARVHLKTIAKQWDSALARLKHFAEDA